MGDRLKYERFIWFHSSVKSKRYPNAAHLADNFEISHRTAQRDIEFMLDRLNAPLEYNQIRKGYFYRDDSYELPAQWFSEDNIIAIALAVRLASSIPDAEIQHELCSLLDRVFSRSSTRKLSLEDIAEKISVKNIEYSRVDEKCFHDIVDALFREIKRRALSHGSEVRVISPK